MDVFLQQPYPVLSSMVIAEKSVNNTDKVDVDQIIRNIFDIESMYK